MIFYYRQIHDASYLTIQTYLRYKFFQGYEQNKHFIYLKNRIKYIQCIFLMQMYHIFS